MKARTLVLILCIGLMCLTGFGSTTADLTENSKTELVQMDDHSVNVAVVSVELEVKDLRSNQADEDRPSFGEANLERFMETDIQNHLFSPANKEALNSQPALRTPDTFDADVGWTATGVENITTPDTSLPARNPRDGLICFS